VVEISVRQWILLLLFIACFTCLTVADGGSWQFMLKLWIMVGWCMLIGIFLFHRYLKSKVDLLLHDDLGKSILNKPMDPEKGQKLVDRWIPSRPRYLVLKDIEEKPGPNFIPRTLTGDPGNPKNPGQQKMFNIMLFGRNEPIFHVIVVRSVFLGLSIYVSVFCEQVVRRYIAVVYPFWQALGITVLGLLPAVIVGTGYLFEVVELSVLATSTEHMRVRKVVDQVERHQKEANAVALMRLIAIIKDDRQIPMKYQDVLDMETALKTDKASGGESAALTKHIKKMLNDNTAELTMARMVATFEAFDVDGSGVLVRDEIAAVFKEIGFDPTKDLDRLLGPMLRDYAQYSKQTDYKKASRPKEPITMQERLMGCYGEAKEIVSPGADLQMGKGLFLAWFLHLEIQARMTSAKTIAEIWFKSIDDDGSGHLSVEELQEVLQGCGRAFSASDVSALILELDQNGDGEFDLGEFTAWIESHGSGH